MDISNEGGRAEDITVVPKGWITYIHYIEGVGGGYVFDTTCVVSPFNASLSLINLITLPICNITDEYSDTTTAMYYSDCNALEDTVPVDLCTCFEITGVEDASYDSGSTLTTSLDL